MRSGVRLLEDEVGCGGIGRRAALMFPSGWEEVVIPGAVGRFRDSCGCVRDGPAKGVASSCGGDGDETVEEAGDAESRPSGLRVSLRDAIATM